MGPWGAVIMSFFGGTFLAAAIVIAAGWNNPWLALPVLVFATIAGIATRKIRGAPAGYFDPGPKAGRVISLSSAFEGIAIPILCTALSATGHPGLIMPGIALIVGLHFLPMAYAIPFRRFYALAGFLLLAALAGAVLPQPTGSVLVGIAAALALWTASVLALTRK